MNPDDLPEGVEIAVLSDIEAVRLENAEAIAPTKIQVELIDAQIDVSDARGAAPDRLQLMIEPKPDGLPYSEWREALREYIEELGPYLRDSNISQARLIWERIDLATKRESGAVSPDDVVTRSIELEKWVGLKSILEAPADAEIPRTILENATDYAMRFASSKLIGSDGVEAAYGVSHT